MRPHLEIMATVASFLCRTSNSLVAETGLGQGSLLGDVDHVRRRLDPNNAALMEHLSEQDLR